MSIDIDPATTRRAPKPELTDDPASEAAYISWFNGESDRIISKATALGITIGAVMQIEELEDEVASLKGRLARYELV